MLIAFFDNDGLIHYEFVSPVQIVNAAYEQVLKRLPLRSAKAAQGLIVGVAARKRASSHCNSIQLTSILVSTRCYCDRSPTVLTRSGTSLFFSVSSFKKCIEEHSFWWPRRHQKECDDDSANTSYRGFFWMFPEAFWTVSEVYWEEMGLFRRLKNIFFVECLFIPFWRNSPNFLDTPCKTREPSTATFVKIVAIVITFWIV